MFISFFTGKVMLFYGISLIMKEKSNASALIRDGAAQHGRPLGRSTVAHFACKVRGAKMKVRRQLNSLHYSP